MTGEELTIIRIGAVWSLFIGLLALAAAGTASFLLYALSAYLQDKSLYKRTAGVAVGLVIAPCILIFLICDLNVWNWVGAISPATEAIHLLMR